MIRRRAPAMTTASPMLSRSADRPEHRFLAGRRAILELNDWEAAHLARRPLILTDTHGGRIVVPAGTGDGDQLMLHDSGGPIMIRVSVNRKT